MSSFCKCKSYSHFFSKNISIGLYAIFNDQNFNDTLTNDILSFEQLGPGVQEMCAIWVVCSSVVSYMAFVLSVFVPLVSLLVVPREDCSS